MKPSAIGKFGAVLGMIGVVASNVWAGGDEPQQSPLKNYNVCSADNNIYADEVRRLLKKNVQLLDDVPTYIFFGTFEDGLEPGGEEDCVGVPPPVSLAAQIGFSNFTRLFRSMVDSHGQPLTHHLCTTGHTFDIRLSVRVVSFRFPSEQAQMARGKCLERIRGSVSHFLERLDG